MQKCTEMYRGDKLFWKFKKYKYLIKMLYNIALNKRPIRKELIEEVGLDRNERII